MCPLHVVVCDAPEGVDGTGWEGLKDGEMELNDGRSLTAEDGEVSNDRRNVDVLIFQ